MNLLRLWVYGNGSNSLQCVLVGNTNHEIEVYHNYYKSRYSNDLVGIFTQYLGLTTSRYRPQ